LLYNNSVIWILKFINNKSNTIIIYRKLTSYIELNQTKPTIYNSKGYVTQNFQLKTYQKKGNINKTLQKHKYSFDKKIWHVYKVIWASHAWRTESQIIKTILITNLPNLV